MRLTSAWLGWRSVRHRPGSVLGATIVLVISAALVSGLSFVYFSADRQEPTVERYSGTPLVIAPENPGDQIPPSLSAAIEEIPQVTAAIPEVTFPATLLDSDNRVVSVPGTERSFGHGWASAPLTPFEVGEGEPPAADGEVVVDRPLAEAGGLTVGETITVLVLGTIEEYRVSGIADPADPTQWRHQSALFFTDSRAAELGGLDPGHTDALGVRPADGVTEAALTAAVDDVLTATGGRYTVLTGTDRGEFEGAVSAENDRFVASSMQTLLVWTMVVTTGVVAGAVGLTVRSRGREIAVLRAVGATPRQVRLMMAGEVAVLSAVALVVGLPLGALLARLLATGGIGLTSNLSAAFRLHYTGSAIVSTVLLVAVSAQVAGVIAARHALRIRPSDALTEATTEGRVLRRGRILAGFLAFGGTLVGAVVLALFDLPEDTVGSYLSGAVVLLAVVGAGLLSPWLMRGVTSSLRSAAARVLHGGPGLAVANVAFYHRRFAGAAGPLVLGITLVGTAGALQLHNNWKFGEQESDRFVSDFVVVAAPGDGFDDETRTAVENLPGVEAAVFSYGVAVDVSVAASDPQETGAMVVHGDANTTVDLDLVEGAFDPRDADAVLVTTFFAEGNGLSVGDGISVAGPGAERVFRISGIYGGNGFLNRPLTLGASAAETIGTGRGLPDGIFLTVEESASPQAVRQELQARFPSGFENAPFEIHDRDDIRRVSTEQWAEQNRAGTTAIILVGVFLVLGAANSISVAQFDRRSEFRSMRLLGITWRQIHRTVAAETVLTATLVFGVAVLVVLWIAVLTALQSGTAALSLLPQILPVAPVAALGAAALLLSVAGALSTVRRIQKGGD